MRLHHVQVACPPGGEDAARRFYADGLGLTELEKPADLRARGGAWFRDTSSLGSSTQGFRSSHGAEIHVGVEDPFRPARKAHPALLLADVAELEAVGERLTGLGFEVDWSQRDSFPGHQRCHTFDGHGNRVEMLSPR
ncbi:MAG TPA: VOC family protein [Nocardioides sp.]|nr:VOC family protein [Nocardioides sp.]